MDAADPPGGSQPFAEAGRRLILVMQPVQQLPHRCWAEIDLAALERNLRLIRASLPAHIKYVAVVKADAYGHGLHQTVARLMHAGADLFAVANVTEAAAIRELGPGWPVLLLSPLLPEEDRYLLEYDITAACPRRRKWTASRPRGREAGRVVAVHLKIDTGMGRLGVWHEDAGLLYDRIRRAEHVRLDGAFTHFSSADDDPAFTDEQRRRFLAALRSCEGLDPARLLIHADNSAGLETAHGEQPFNAVRVGLLQFGILPHPNSMLARVHTEPVFSFRTRVGLVKSLPAGTDISYNRTRTLQRDSTVAVLCAGYGDGIARACSNRAQVLVHGVRCLCSDA
jgi:alanine racemase